MKPLYSVNKHGKNQGWGTYLKLFKEGNKNGECKIKNKYWTSKMDKKYYAVIYTAYGIIGGKIQTTSKEITIGKNIGRANETNVLLQAVLEMKSMWTHQVERKGYMDKISTTVGEGSTTVGSMKIGTVRPMLLGKYEPGKVKFPACIETKYDGMRCLAHYENGKVVLRTRTGTIIEHLDHIRKDLLKIKEFLTGKVFIDGELYGHEIEFEDIISLTRKTKTITDEIKIKQKKIKFYVFDLINENNLKMTLRERKKMLDKMFDGINLKYIVLVKCTVVNSDEDVQKFHKKVSKEYEGSVIKKWDGIYEIAKRSNNVLKLKNFSDAEFKIVGIGQGTGKEKGLAILELVTEDGKKFKARPTGSYEYRAKMFNEKKKLIGKYATVKFMETTKDGIPRHGVVLAIRDYE